MQDCRKRAGNEYGEQMAKMISSRNAGPIMPRHDPGYGRRGPHRLRHGGHSI
jgi:hypothetical protein